MVRCKRCGTELVRGVCLVCYAEELSSKKGGLLPLLAGVLVSGLLWVALIGGFWLVVVVVAKPHS